MYFFAASDMRWWWSRGSERCKSFPFDWLISTRFREDQSVIGSLSKRFSSFERFFGVRLRAHCFAARFNQVMIYGQS